MQIMSLNDLNMGSSSKPKNSNNIMTKAIKDYKDECLTGLTDEEKEKIRQELSAYQKKYPDIEKTKSGRNILLSLLQNLLRAAGFKGDIEEYSKGFLSEFLTSNSTKSTTDLNEDTNEDPNTTIQNSYRKQSIESFLYRDGSHAQSSNTALELTSHLNTHPTLANTDEYLLGDGSLSPLARYILLGEEYQ